VINQALNQLVTYGLQKGLIAPADRTYTVNRLLETLNLDSYEEPDEIFGESGVIDLPEVLDVLADFAAEHGLIAEDSITYRDLFDTKLMGCLTPRPSEVIAKFNSLYAVSPVKATDWYYAFSRSTNYIRNDRIAKDVQWKVDTEYGEIDITINLSKPEKDPKAIAAARNMPSSSYPKCLLCSENEGYAGRVNHPARQNHRIIPVSINNRPWFLQYSPYVYYNEHCIVFNQNHIPMKIDRDCFAKLLDFVRQFPHYFVGSNADLPLVGGSILSHDHFQGGRYSFPMEKAEIESRYCIRGFEDVSVGTVKWPLSVIRLSSENIGRLVDLADKILTAWRCYTDESAFIYARTDGEPHNTITPIARMRNGKYELDLALRNNITTAEHPMGVYHPHAEIHHIKRENIGLIEVMGLAVLPARLKEELAVLADKLVSGADLRSDERTVHHADWAKSIVKSYAITSENVDEILKAETGKVFTAALEHSGVFKRDEDGVKAFTRFIKSL
jgi:UDPglucose--hexose-1-phosphate uridylyltransferase